MMTKTLHKINRSNNNVSQTSHLREPRNGNDKLPEEGQYYCTSLVYLQIAFWNKLPLAFFLAKTKKTLHFFSPKMFLVDLLLSVRYIYIYI